VGRILSRWEKTFLSHVFGWVVVGARIPPWVLPELLAYFSLSQRERAGVRGNA
jgi:hypothetical protein